MLLMFDLACRELQNPLEERMPFHGFLCEAASPTLQEPHWALNPAPTLAVGVGREHRLIWRKNWFILQVETGIIHSKPWKQSLVADTKTMVLLVTKGAGATVLHPKCLQFPHLALFSASTGLLWGLLQPLLPVPASRTKLKAVLCDLVCQRKKRALSKAWSCSACCFLSAMYMKQMLLGGGCWTGPGRGSQHQHPEHFTHSTCYSLYL